VVIPFLLPMVSVLGSAYVAYQIGYTLGAAGGLEAATRQLLGG
jgi:hypothetical protein